MYVNGIADRSLGLSIEDFDQGIRSGVSVSDVTVGLPGVAGMQLTGAMPQFAVRQIVLEGLIRRVGTDTLEATERKLAYMFQRGLLELVFAHDLTKMIRGRCTSFGVVRKSPGFLATSTRCRIEITCYDPYYYDVDPIVITLKVNESSWTSVPYVMLGTAPVRPLIWLSQAVNPEIIYRRSDGTEKARMTITHTIGVTERVKIDCARYTIEKITAAGVVTNIADALSADSRWFVLDPSDGDFISSLYSRMEMVTIGHYGSITYRRAYLS
jgi:hypothetical protein